jgi:hypothetical protein
MRHGSQESHSKNGNSNNRNRSINRPTRRGVSVFGLKGQYNIAQGNALGTIRK